jgi:uncharacterized protein (TIGR00725 family)
MSLEPTHAPRLLPIVGVIGSGATAGADAAELGAWLAEENVHLVTGGGTGVMHAVSEAFCMARSPAHRGAILGILPCSSADRTRPKRGYPNPWVEIPIHTHLPLSGDHGQDDLSRNHLIVLTASVIIAMPGSSGTSSEVALALQYRRPIVAFLRDGGTIPDLSPAVLVESDFERVKAFVRSALARARERSTTQFR